ncbi:GNAT family N-acetyltransferase [Brachybacterium alimentarium]|uniref:GNAT family N-acetyltransferase n=1 Tax=Brachybacterium alimentarium TaxID=47845 RepID=UPI003FCF3AC3
MDILELDGMHVTVARAQVDDLPAIISLLADDVLGRDREITDAEPYETAFRQIEQDPNQLVIVVREADAADGPMLATMQLTLMPSLSRGGAVRLQIEAVRVAASTRGTGLGTALFQWAHEWGREHGARLAQLTTDSSRTDAHRFYERLGYEASHVGFKLPL